MNTLAGRIVLALTIGGLIGLSCEKPATPNRAPTITSLDLPDSIGTGADATVSCTASDSDGGALGYEWTCSAGSLLPTTGVSVVWSAPETSGTATIAVTVRDDSSASDTASGTVVVHPVTTTLLDWTGLVDAYDVQIWTRNYIPAGHTLSGSFSVAAHDITLLVLDSINYQNWRSSQPYDALVDVQKSTGSDFSAVVPVYGTYHFVLDNTYNANTDSSVHLVVKQTSP